MLRTYNISHCSINLLVLNVFNRQEKKKEEARLGNRKTQNVITRSAGQFLQKETSTKSNMLPGLHNMKNINQKGLPKWIFPHFSKIIELTFCIYVMNTRQLSACRNCCCQLPCKDTQEPGLETHRRCTRTLSHGLGSGEPAHPEKVTH